MGALLIVFGLHSIGLINVPIFNYTRHMDIRGLQNLGYLKSLLIGMAFAFGLGPCTSFQLGLILTMAISDPLSASLYFLIYGLGLGVPFLVVGMAMGQISKGMKKLTRRSYSLKIGSWTAIDKVNIVSLVSGIILVIMGLLAITDTLKYLSTIQLPWATPEL
jgi:cytochrome c-type biogenesis protein